MVLPAAIFFDFDGTLVDSNSIKREAFFRVTEDIPDCHAYIDKLLAKDEALTRYEVFRRVCARFLAMAQDTPDFECLMSRYSKSIVATVSDAPEIFGTSRLLAQLKIANLPAFVCSATPSEDLLKIMRQRGWSEYFTEVRGAPKTKIENIEELRTQYGLSRSSCLVIGDRWDDYDAAKKTKIKFLGVGESFKQSQGQSSKITVVGNMDDVYQKIFGSCIESA
jgi:phosphoglycolate phosphatase-like HAD superfamily hydrolase